jgi:tetratricopeptide (TPR) repeat protein
LSDDGKKDDAGTFGEDAIEIDFGSPEPVGDGEPERVPEGDEQTADSDLEELWDDLPETEIDEGELDSDFFRGFEDVDAEVYDGIPTDEDIATEGTARDEEAAPAELAVEEDDTEIVIEEGEAGEEDLFESMGDFLDYEGWSTQRWQECAAELLEDARAHEDPAVSARLLAAAARVTETRLDDVGEAVRLYESARQLDAGCLAAIQGARRLALAERRFDDAEEAVEEELAAADDVPIKRRLEDLAAKIGAFERGRANGGSLASEDPYHAIAAFTSSLAAGEAGRAAEAAAAIASLSDDGLFVSTLCTASGLLSEIAGSPDDARQAYEQALEARESDEIARLAMSRMHALGREWREAERRAGGVAAPAGGPATPGLGLLRAALEVLALGRTEDAREIVGALPDHPPELLLGLLASLSDPEAFAGRLERVTGDLPAGSLRGSLEYVALGAGSRQPGADDLRRVCEQVPELGAAALEAVEMLTGAHLEDRAPVLDAVLEAVGDTASLPWLQTEAALGLLEAGRDEEALRVLSRASDTGLEDEIVVAALVSTLRREDGGAAPGLIDMAASRQGDPEQAVALKLLRADLGRFDAEDPSAARDVLSSLPRDSALASRVVCDLVIDGADAWPEALDEALQSAAARGCAAAAFVALLTGRREDDTWRRELLERVLEVDPGHLPAFAAVRRELLAAGAVERYGEVLEAWCEARAELESERLLGERVALLSLGAPSSLGEQQLGEYLDRSRDDAFLPLFLASLVGSFPALGAEAAEKLASLLEGEEADRWWFEAARRWSGVDGQRAGSALGNVSGERWSRAAHGLMEASAWMSGRWDDVAGVLIEAVRQQPEGETSVDLLARMVYVDGFCKGERSMALAEAESLLEATENPDPFCLRFLYTSLVAADRLEDARPVVERLAASLAGVPESTAFVWLALRLARLGAGPPERPEELLRSTLETRAQDLPLLFLADGRARRRRDTDLLRSVVSEMAGTMDEPREQGALLWVLAVLGAEADPERAFSAAREAQENLPANPAAALLVEQMAASREDWAAAAMFARQAGSLTRQTTFAVEDLLRAGEIYRDRLGEGGWAVQCFEQAMNLDPSDGRAFDALRQHFGDLGEWDHVASLMEERVQATEDDAARHALLRELAHVYENASRDEEAIASLRRILAEEPEDAESLSSLASLCIRTSSWEEAIDALQERSLLPMDREQKIHLFTTLGGLYVDQVPNDKKAVVCFEKVLSEGDPDLDVVRRLARLYEKTGAWEKGLKMAEMLFNAAEDEEDKAAWLVTAGRLWQEGAGDLRRAEQSYEMARKQTPGAAEPVVALVNLYRQQGDQRALSFHLERSMGDLEHFVRDDPGNLKLYHTAFEIARSTGDRHAIRVAGTLLESLYDLHVDERTDFEEAGGTYEWSLGPWVAEESIDEIIAPESFTPSFRVLAARLRDPLLKSVDHDPQRFGISRATRLSKRYGKDVKIADDVARHFGIKPLSVHLTDLIPSVLTVLSDTPPVLVIGEPLYRTLSEAQKRFAFAWGCKLVASGLAPFVSLGQGGLPALWVALMQQFEPSFFISGVDADETVKLSAALRKHVPKKVLEDLFGAGIECSGDQRIDVSRLYKDISSFADRAALLGCGDMGAALQFVWVVSSGDEPFNSDYTAAKALEESDALMRIVEFIVSGRFARALPEQD